MYLKMPDLGIYIDTECRFQAIQLVKEDLKCSGFNKQ